MLQQLLQSEDFGRCEDTLLQLSAGKFSPFQTEGQVIVDRRSWIGHVILRHQGNVALFRRQNINRTIAEAEVSFRKVIQPASLFSSSLGTRRIPARSGIPSIETKPYKRLFVCPDILMREITSCPM